MKTIYYSKIFYAVLLVAFMLGSTSCIKNLDIQSIDPQTTPSFQQHEVFVKAYALLGVTGQKGVAGSQDLDGQDEGESGFYRTVFNCNELPTDECVWAWQENVDIPQLTTISWNSSSIRTEWLYVRLGYNINMYNFFLDQTEDKTDEESLRQRAEVRFLRALHYSYYLDFFGKAPFKVHFNNELPIEKKGSDLYDFIQDELKECETDMFDPRKAPYGRADKAANWLLRARLYLNAKVYTGKADYANARDFATKVIDSSYELADNYEEIFMADNDENVSAMKEIIFPIRQDGLKIRSYSGSYFLISSTRISGMPYMGTTDGWSCIFARPTLIQKFFSNLEDVPMLPADVKVPEKEEISSDEKINNFDEQYSTRTIDMIEAAGDDRALFYSGIGGGIRKLETDAIRGFNDGLSIVKWQNIRSDGKATSHTMYPDTDIPLFRISEAYLTRAEALFRLGEGNPADDINKLRNRANCVRKVQTVTEKELIDEWAREFYLEGRRRSDLIRFDMFTSSKYLWPWKGGVKEGTSVSSFYNVYPIPASDLTNNSVNLTQNPGY